MFSFVFFHFLLCLFRGRGADAGDEDADQFIGFLKKWVEVCWAFDEWDILAESEPSPGFLEFLQANLHFVTEIFRRFGGLCLAVL